MTARLTGRTGQRRSAEIELGKAGFCIDGDEGRFQQQDEEADITWMATRQ